jgi:type IV pilus assembly protein PilE
MSRTRQSGFTLMELMITVAVIGILAAVAYPSYLNYITRANRSAAQSFMFSVTNKQQQYLLDARYFAGGASALTDLSMTVPTEVSSKYTITVACTMPAAVANCTAAVGAPAYTITATPIGGQATNDTACAVLTLNSAGVKTKSGTATSLSDCW